MRTIVIYNRDPDRSDILTHDSHYLGVEHSYNIGALRIFDRYAFCRFLLYIKQPTPFGVHRPWGLELLEIIVSTQTT